MAVPADKAYVDLVLTVLGDGKTHSIVDLGREAEKRFQSPPDGSNDPMASGDRTRHRYHSYLAVARLFQKGLVERSPEGLFRITSHGRAVLILKRQSIRFPRILTEMKVLTVVFTVLIPVYNTLKRRSIRTLLIWTAVSAALGLLLFWGGFDRGPTRPPFPDGGILVFVNEPHESADINFIVDTQGDFSVSVSSTGAGSFLVIASGSAAVETAQNTSDSTGSPPVFTRGIRINSVATSRGTAIGQQQFFIADRHHQFGINGYAGDPDVAAAVAFQNTTNTSMGVGGYYFVQGKLRNPIVSSSSSGSVELGQLPLMGAATSLTEYNPVNQRIEPISGPVTISGQIPHTPRANGITKWYAPTARVNISVTSSPAAVSEPNPDQILQPLLPPDYKLDSAGPSTVNANELLWQAAGNVQVTWNLTNLSAARQASLWLFLSGILFGIAASFLGVLTDRLLEERGPNKKSA